MLKVVIEIIPGGVRELRRTIASMSIGNVSNLADISDYQIDAAESMNPLTGTSGRSATCKVVGHDRRSSVWALIAKAADAVQKAEFDEL